MERLEEGGGKERWKEEGGGRERWRDRRRSRDRRGGISRVRCWKQDSGERWQRTIVSFHIHTCRRTFIITYYVNTFEFLHTCLQYMHAQTQNPSGSRQLFQRSNLFWATGRDNITSRVADRNKCILSLQKGYPWYPFIYYPKWYCTKGSSVPCIWLQIMIAGVQEWLQTRVLTSGCLQFGNSCTGEVSWVL